MNELTKNENDPARFWHTVSMFGKIVNQTKRIK